MSLTRWNLKQVFSMIGLYTQVFLLGKDAFRWYVLLARRRSPAEIAGLNV